MKRRVVLSLVCLFVLAAMGRQTAASPVNSDRSDRVVRVDARSNVFGQGVGVTRTTYPGIRAPSLGLRAAQTVVFPSVRGSVNCCSGAPANWNGPSGGRSYSTNINSNNGVSGITHKNLELFLVGVFIGASPCSGTGPERLDVTNAINHADTAPLLCQTFYIGNGKTAAGALIRVHVPNGATRLVLGFADAFAFSGDPSYYDDNKGFLIARVRVMH